MDPARETSNRTYVALLPCHHSKGVGVAFVDGTPHLITPPALFNTVGHHKVRLPGRAKRFPLCMHGHGVPAIPPMNTHCPA